MKAKTKNQSSNQASTEIDLYGDFQGKLSFIFRFVNIIINLSISESPNVQNNNYVISKFNELNKCEEDKMTKSLYEFIFQDLNKSLELIHQTRDKYTLIALTNLSLFIKKKINFDKLFMELIKDLNLLIDLVKKNGSKPSSIKIIDDFYEYANDYLNKLVEMKKVVNEKKYKEEERGKNIQYEKKIESLQSVLKKKEKEEKDMQGKSFQYEKKIESLQKTLKEKEKELDSLNDRFVKESLDKNTYKEDNQSLYSKIKELESKMDNMYIQRAESEKKMKIEMEERDRQITKDFERKLAEKDREMKFEIEKMKKTISQQDKIILDNTMKINELYLMLEHNGNLITRLENTTQELTEGHNDLVNLTVNLNNSLAQIFPYLDDIANATNPFNFDFFKK